MTETDDQGHELIVEQREQRASFLVRSRRVLAQKSVLLLLAGLLLVIIGSVIWLQKTHHANTMVDDERHKYEATVIMDGKTMLPATLSVKSDTEVFFENHSTSNDQDEAGPAIQLKQSKANTDQAPNFSAGSIAAGSGYGYIFRKGGTYRFFNPASVQQTITIVVGR